MTLQNNAGAATPAIFEGDIYGDSEMIMTIYDPAKKRQELKCLNGETSRYAPECASYQFHPKTRENFLLQTENLIRDDLNEYNYILDFFYAERQIFVRYRGDMSAAEIEDCQNEVILSNNEFFDNHIAVKGNGAAFLVDYRSGFTFDPKYNGGAGLYGSLLNFMADDFGVKPQVMAVHVLSCLARQGDEAAADVLFWLNVQREDSEAAAYREQTERLELEAEQIETTNLPVTSTRSWYQETLSSVPLFKCDQSGAADRLEYYLKGQIIYDRSTKVWFFWNGKYWEPIGTPFKHVTDIFNEFLPKERELAMIDAVKKGIDAEKIRKDYSNHQKQAVGTAYVEQSLKQLSVRPGFFAESGFSSDTCPKFDSHKNLLNLRNGVLNLKTRELMPHNPELLITKYIDIDYVRECAEPYRFKQFMHSCFEKDGKQQHDIVEYVLTFCGSLLSGDGTINRKFHIFLGGGSDGKTVLTDMQVAVMGSYAAVGQGEALIADHSGAGRFAFGHLAAVRYVAFEETPQNAPLDCARVKILTGDSARIRIEMKGVQSFEIVPQFQITLNTNHPPVIRDQTASIWNRVGKVFFPNSRAEKDQNKFLRQELLTEKTEILNYLIRYCFEWYAAGCRLPYCEALETAKQEYRSDEDTLKEWLESIGDKYITIKTLTGEPLKKFTLKDVFDDYKTFSNENGNLPLGKKMFSKAICDERQIFNKVYSGGVLHVWQHENMKTS